MTDENSKNKFPLLLAKEGKKYQVDLIVGKDATTKHLMEIGFVKDVVLELVKCEKNGVIVKIFGSKIALDFQLAQKIYVHEFEMENIETM